MPVCSYLVFPRRGRHVQAAASLASIPGCEVTPAEHHELFVLVTSSADACSEESLRAAIEAVEDVQCLALSFGEVQPEPFSAGDDSTRPMTDPRTAVLGAISSRTEQP